MLDLRQLKIECMSNVETQIKLHTAYKSPDIYYEMTEVVR